MSKQTTGNYPKHLSLTSTPAHTTRERTTAPKMHSTDHIMELTHDAGRIEARVAARAAGHTAGRNAAHAVIRAGIRSLAEDKEATAGSTHKGLTTVYTKPPLGNTPDFTVSPIVSCTSAKTDRNQVPAGLKAAIAWGYIQNSYTVLDWGSGQGDKAKAYMERKLYNPTYMPFDPYNVPHYVNSATLRHAKAGMHNVVACFNCLNVLQDGALFDTLHALRNSSLGGNKGKGCNVILSMYEGDRSGVGRYTMKGASYQRNETAAHYMPLLKGRFNKVVRTRGLFICSM